MDLSFLFNHILQTSLIGSILVVLILLVKILLKKRLNYYVHYYLWILVLIKLLFPYTIKSSISLYNISKPIINDNFQTTSTIVTNTLPDNAINNHPIISNTLNNSSNLLSTIFISIWIVGVLLFLFLMVISLIKILYLKAHALEYSNIELDKSLEEALAITKIERKVKLVYTSKLYSPALFGIFKPVIFIPLKLLDKLDQKQVKYILLHELCHLRRSDIILNYIINILKAIYWFNPILLYGFHRMHQDCEIACDGEVISFLSKDENTSYGESIMNISRLSDNFVGLPGTTSLIMNKSQLKRRIVMVAKYKKLSKRSLVLGIIIFLVLGSIGLSSSLSKPVKATVNDKAVTTSIATPTAVIPTTATKEVTPSFNYADNLKALNITLSKNWHLDSSNKVEYAFLDDKGNNVGNAGAMPYTPGLDFSTQLPNHSLKVKEETLQLPIGSCVLFTLDSDNGSAASGLTGTHDSYMAGITTKANTMFLIYFSKNDKELRSKPQFLEILKGLKLN